MINDVNDGKKADQSIKLLEIWIDKNQNVEENLDEILLVVRDKS